MKKFATLPFASKTLVVAILTVIAGIAAYFGYTISAEEIELIATAIIAIGTAIGGIFAIGQGIKNRKSRK